MILENVEWIKHVDKGEVFKTILEELDGIGYDVHVNTIMASNFGIPQTRKRVYFLCVHKRLRSKVRVEKPKPTFEKIYLEDILESKQEIDKQPHLLYNKFFKEKDFALDRSKKENILYTILIGGWGNRSFQKRIRSVKGHCGTVLACSIPRGLSLANHTSGCFYVDGNLRALSEIEIKRIMGFPEFFCLDSDLDLTEKQKQKLPYHLLGNAVIPKMIKVVFECLKPA